MVVPRAAAQVPVQTARENLVLDMGCLLPSTINILRWSKSFCQMVLVLLFTSWSWLRKTFLARVSVLYPRRSPWRSGEPLLSAMLWSPSAAAIPHWEMKKRPRESKCKYTGRVRFAAWMGVSSPSQLCSISWEFDTFPQMALWILLPF